jgi:DNA adenine methylase
MLSNSDPKNTDESDEFFDELYSQYTIHRVNARRAINSDGKGRGEITEILVTNY